MIQVAQEETTSLKDLSVDEIFSRYSVHQVKNLHREYHASVEKARSDLHCLVGEKYRDLIQIAEDIDKMNDMSKSIDNQLTNLSYKPASHVSFGNNAYSKFDKKRREKNSKAARDASRNTIFNNILNSKVLSFDLKLQGSTHINSWYLVHMAKVYYTIKSIFQTNASETAHTEKNLAPFKKRFNEYLEEKIASRLPYTSSAEGAQSGILVSSSSQWLESSSVDLLDGSMEEDGEENSDDENCEDLGQRKFFATASSPMSNYIAAYIILNSGDETLASLELVARKIIDLRFTFLQDHLTYAFKKSPKDAININFSFIIAFAESTNSCISKYFLESETSDLMAIVQRGYSWKAYDFIGFHSWFDNEDVLFDTSNYKSLDACFLVSSANKGTSLAEFIFKTFKDIAINSEQNVASERVKTALSLFFNFMTACRKAEVVAQSNEHECLTVQSFSWFDLPQKILNFVVEFVEELSVEAAGSTEHILSQIKSDLAVISPKVDTVQELFDKDSIKLIDDDFEKYFGGVLATEPEQSSVSEAAFVLKQWLKEQRFLSILVSTSENSLVSDTLEILNKPFQRTKSFESWGTFNSSTCESVFSNLNDRRRTSLRTEVSLLLEEIKKVSFCDSQQPTSATLHYTLNLVDLLKTHSSLYGDSELQLKMDGTLRRIFMLLFDSLQSEDSNYVTAFFESLVGSLTIDAAVESTTVPVLPHLRISSGIEKVASLLFSSKHLSSSELYDIFSSESNQEIFVNVKNAWVSETLIEAKIIQSIESNLSESITITDEEKPISESEDTENASDDANPTDNSIEEELSETPHSDCEDVNGSEQKPKEGNSSKSIAPQSVVKSLKPHISSHKLAKGQSRQLMANIAFLLCFVNKQSSNSTKLDALAKRISELSESEIEESTLNVIARGVNEFYKSSKHLYLPLSMN